jgi:hypothetical protein
MPPRASKTTGARAHAQVLLATITSFRDHRGSELRPLTLFALQAMIHGGFRNPAKDGSALAIYPVFRLDAIVSFGDVLDSKNGNAVQ